MRCHLTLNDITDDTEFSVSAHNYDISIKYYVALDFPPLFPNLPVGYKSQVIHNKNLNLYQFSDEESGCRHWV
jgi:hypothetical protein